MAKRAKRTVQEPPQRKILRSIRRIQAQETVTESELVRQITEVLRAGNVRVLEQGKSRRMTGDLLFSRTELGQERRYIVEIVVEIKVPVLQLLHLFRNLLDRKAMCDRVSELVRGFQHAP